MPRLSSLLALCAALAVCSPALAVETLHQMDAEVAREAAEAPEQRATEDARTQLPDSEPASEAASVSSIAAAGLEAGEATAPSAGQTRSGSSAPVQRPGARWNAFLPGMVR